MNTAREYIKELGGKCDVTIERGEPKEYPEIQDCTITIQKVEPEK